METELVVGFHKKDSGKPSITWPESVDGALCFGWIDGVRRSIDADSYSIRFTPRKARSFWSSVNIRRVGVLTQLGLMREAGLRAFSARTGERSGVYAFEQETVQFLPAQESIFKKNKVAWEFFGAQPKWYRKTATWWVISAKREETRIRRLATLIAESEAGKTIRELNRNQGK